MSDSKDIVSDTADGLKTIFGRLGEFFHIFDLSFFVAGAVSFGAIVFLFQRLGIDAAFPFAPWVAGLALVIACYVCGMVSFAVGRFVNGYLFRRGVLPTLLRRSIEVHQPSDPLMEQYLAKGDSNLWRLYIRLWQELAAKQPHSAVFSHLSRYWAMAATCDGLAISLILWAVVIVASVFAGTPALLFRQAIVVVVIFILAAITFLRQGGKYYEFQVEDLVAALAVAKNAGTSVAVASVPVSKEGGNR